MTEEVKLPRAERRRAELAKRKEDRLSKDQPQPHATGLSRAIRNRLSSNRPSVKAEVKEALRKMKEKAKMGLTPSTI